MVLKDLRTTGLDILWAFQRSNNLLTALSCPCQFYPGIINWLEWWNLQPVRMIALSTNEALCYALGLHVRIVLLQLHLWILMNSFIGSRQSRLLRIYCIFFCWYKNSNPVSFKSDSASLGVFKLKMQRIFNSISISKCNNSNSHMCILTLVGQIAWS